MRRSNGIGRSDVSAEREAPIEPARKHLHVVDDATGEVETLQSVKAELQRQRAIVTGLERDVRGWMVRYRELERDKAAEAREHALWPVAGLLFRGWRKRCNHSRAVWTPDRFWVAEPFLSSGKYGKTLEARVTLCAQAIAGAGFDAFSVKRRNGTVKRFDDWGEGIFASAGKFEDFCNRAPLGWQPTLSEPMRQAIIAAEAKIAQLQKARA